MIKRSHSEIIDLLERCDEVAFTAGNFPGMTYEEGVMYCLEWLLGEKDEDPLSE
jgi:hypothetical protein